MQPPSAEPAPSQFRLLCQRRFAPFFAVQFLGAANDNLFKFAFTLLVTYQLRVSWLPPSLAGPVIGGVFILPFVLFSASSGQLADKLDKRRLIGRIKSLELGIMLLAAWGFLHDCVGVLLGCVFLMGLHSTLFGPVKYAYLPCQLGERELTGGNGMVEMGTFVAILLGNLAGGLLVGLPGGGARQAAGACVVLAAIGRLAALAIPSTPASDPGLRLNRNPFSETWRNLRQAHVQPVLFRSLLGISWMWFFGAVFLSQFPSLGRDVLHGDEQVASLLLVVFSLGIATGSLLCERLGRGHVEIGLVPLGAIGMSVFAVDLYLAAHGLPPAPRVGVREFLGVQAHWHVLFALFGLSLSAGLYSVPMYALIQLRAEPTHRARIAAANNILNALLMVASAVAAVLLLRAGCPVPRLFLIAGLANAVVAGYIFLLVPEYLLRFFAWGLTHLVYRFEVRGEAELPRQGPAVLVCNHVSFVDAVLLMGASPRPVRFVMDHRMFRAPLLGWLFRLVRAIPIAPRAENPALYQAALDQALRTLHEGDLLGIFPEGAITGDGQLQEFRPGVLRIVERARAEGLEVPIIPMALTGLWGSFFSRIERRGGRPAAMVRPLRRGLFNRVCLRIGPPVAANQATTQGLRATVHELGRV